MYADAAVRGQKDTVCGHLRTTASFPVRYRQKEETGKSKRDAGLRKEGNFKRAAEIKGGRKMRHMYVRCIIGVILLGAALIGGGPLCIILGAMMLCSALSLWKKGKDGDSGEKGE